MECELINHYQRNLTINNVINIDKGEFHGTPNSRTTFKNYCLRSLGSGVIDINVSDDQVDDRIDEALQYFAEYHYDGYERMYLKHLVTEADVTRARDNITTSVTDVGDGTTTVDWLEGKNWIPVPNTVLSIVQVFPFTDTGGGSNMFDIRYQLRLNDLFDLSSTSVIQYQMAMDNLDFLEHILVGKLLFDLVNIKRDFTLMQIGRTTSQQTGLISLLSVIES